MPAMFSRFPSAFFDEKPNDGYVYAQILGLVKNRRVWKHILREFISASGTGLDYFKVFIPKANGSGTFGEVFSTPVLGTPVQASTESFISIGRFATKEEASSCLSYVCTKFFRAMVGILKVTQDNSAAVFKCVPLQDFTSASDIDWSQSVADIDRQLYAKYGLSEDEISFIESHVKEMS